MKVEIQKEWYSIKQAKDNPDKIYVFGDNLIGKGTGGQAKIRYAKNSFGIPTKRLPSRTKNAYFSDQMDEKIAIYDSIIKLKKMYDNGKTIVFPVDGLGTGLSKMPEFSPKLFKYMNNLISKTFNIKYFI
jgi:hypothetical protein